MHSEISGSMIHRLLGGCLGYVRMVRGRPDETSEYAAEGSAAHYLGETCLRRNKEPGIYLGRLIRKVDKGYSILKKGAEKQPGDWEVTQEMVESIRLYVNTIRADQALRPHAELHVEVKVNLNEIYPGSKGYADAILEEHFGRTTLYDLKYGRGHAVEVEENEQEMFYALGAYLRGDFEEVELVIIQPRADHPGGPVRRWVISSEALVKWGKETLAPAVKRAMEDPDAPLQVGEHCLFCRARKDCPAQKEHMLDALQVESLDKVIDLPAPDALSLEDMVKVLDGRDLIVDWMNSVASHAQSLLRDGGVVPGYKLVQKRTHRKWADNKEVLKRMLKFKTWAFKPEEPLSPSQMEKAAKKMGIDPGLDDLIIRPEGDVVIAKETDSRPAFQPVSFVNMLTDDF